MARTANILTAAKRARKPKDNSGAASLVEALKFVSLAQHKEGAQHQTHCSINAGRIIAFDGVIAAGHLIEDDLSACPHTTRLLDALGKCGANLAIAQLDSGRLSIKSDRFKAFVPCIPFGQLADIEPDSPCAVIDDRLKAGFELVLPLLSDTAASAHLAAALLQNNSIVGTNGACLIEYWHGINLPDNLLIPKAALTAITKTAKKLARFGFSANSVTFFFDDNSFIKSQLFSESYPDYRAVIDCDSNPWPLPEGFYDGLKKIRSLADNGLVYFSESGMYVKDANKTETGSYEIQGLQPGLAFNIDFLSIVEPVFKQVHFDVTKSNGKTLFFADTARGAIMGCRGG